MCLCRPLQKLMAGIVDSHGATSYNNYANLPRPWSLEMRRRRRRRRRRGRGRGGGGGGGREDSFQAAARTAEMMDNAVKRLELMRADCHYTPGY